VHYGVRNVAKADGEYLDSSWNQFRLPAKLSRWISHIDVLNKLKYYFVVMLF